MTKVTARHGNSASLYRTRQPVGRTNHVTEREPSDMIFPQYRGWRLACLAGEIEAVKRRIDAYWADRRPMAYERHGDLILTPKEVARFRRRAAILQESVALRERGATFEEIGSLYGVTRQAAHHMLDGVSINPQRN